MNLILTMLSLINMYQVLWQNTTIDIPLNDATTNYYELPEATLYYQGKIITTNEYYYERGVNRTSLSVVNSNHVKAFKIDYRITFYELGVTSEQTITFNIVDEIPPTILKVPEFKFPLNTKIPTDKVMLEGFYYQDNYYSNEELVTKVNRLSEININKVGLYEIEYEVMDPSFNTTVATTTYEIFDNNYPEITMIKNEIEHLVKTEFKVYDHFKFKGVNLIIDANLSQVNINKIGTYPITVTATNESGLSQSLSVHIKIIDDVKPLIRLKSNINDFNVYDKVNHDDLLNLILSVSDNYDNLSKEDVIVDTDLNTNIIGKYVVIFSIKDTSNNEFTIQTNINVKDLEKPNIILLEKIILNINEEPPYFLKYFEIFDNYNSYDELTININDKNINYKKNNTYYLEITINDQSKNVLKATFEVIVSDLTSPVVSQVNDLFIYNFKRESKSFYKKHFNITDNFDQYDDIDLEIIDDNVNYEKIGQYPIELLFIDSNNNQTLIKSDIYVIDTEKPKINLKSDIYYYFIGEAIIEIIALVTSVDDNYDLLKVSDIIVMGDINYNKIGKYEVYLILSDTSENETKIQIDCYVDVKKSKLINGNDITINKDNKWEPLEGIELSENVIKYQYYNGLSNTNQIGEFEIIYVAYDIRGNLETYKQKVMIIDNKTSLKSNYLLIILITSIFIGIASFNYYKDSKTKREYFDKDY